MLAMLIAPSWQPSACPKGGEAMPSADPFSRSDAFGREAPG